MGNHEKVKRRVVFLLVLVLLLLLSPLNPLLPKVFSTGEIKMTKSYHGTLDEIVSQVQEEFGPLEERIRLQDGAWYKGELFSVQILKDNYLKGDYVVFVSF